VHSLSLSLSPVTALAALTPRSRSIESTDRLPGSRTGIFFFTFSRARRPKKVIHVPGCVWRCGMGAVSGECGGGIERERGGEGKDPQSKHRPSMDGRGVIAIFPGKGVQITRLKARHTFSGNSHAASAHQNTARGICQGPSYALALQIFHRPGLIGFFFLCPDGGSTGIQRKRWKSDERLSRTMIDRPILRIPSDFSTPRRSYVVGLVACRRLLLPLFSGAGLTRLLASLALLYLLTITAYFRGVIEP
jgi:hypothetical protein